MEHEKDKDYIEICEKDDNRSYAILIHKDLKKLIAIHNEFDNSKRRKFHNLNVYFEDDK